MLYISACQVPRGKIIHSASAGMKEYGLRGGMAIYITKLASTPGGMSAAQTRGRSASATAARMRWRRDFAARSISTGRKSAQKVEFKLIISLC